jgi:glucokinase
VRVGVDIGGTKTHAVAIDGTGRPVHQVLAGTGSGAAAVLAAAVDTVTRLAEDCGMPTWQFESIGVGIPGTVDVASGRVANAVNLKIDELELGGELSLRLGSPVHVENDVNAAAFGAFRLLSGTLGGDSMAYLNLGTGLAAGLVLHGELWRGARGGAGEIGHIPVDPNGPRCSCGQRGCLETVASGSAIAREWPTGHPRPVQELFQAAAAGKHRAIEVKRRLVRNVASAARLLVLTMDVETVVFGGGISSLGEPLLEAVREVFADWAADSPFLASLDLPGRVAVLPDEFPAAAVGAALVGGTVSEVL